MKRISFALVFVTVSGICHGQPRANTAEACLRAALQASAGVYEARGNRLNENAGFEKTDFTYVAKFDNAALTYIIDGKKSGIWSLNKNQYILTIFDSSGVTRTFPVNFECADTAGLPPWHISESWIINDRYDQNKKWAFRQRRTVHESYTDVETTIRLVSKSAPYVLINSFRADRIQQKR